MEGEKIRRTEAEQITGKEDWAASDIRLVALDLDGTLLNSRGKISQTDQEAIREAVREGVEIVISTGRPYSGLPVEQLVSLGVKYAITANGAAVYRLPGRELLDSSCLDRRLICGLLREAERYRVHFDVFIDGEGYSQKSFLSRLSELGVPETTKEYIRATRKFKDRVIDYVEEMQADVQKVTFNFYRLADGTYQDYSQIRELLASTSGVTYLSGGFHNLEVTAAGVEKGKGLRFLVGYLGISLEQTMACGDSPNDLDILRTAGLSVAMANAEEEVKQAAAYRTLSNDEGGVAYAIRKYIPGRSCD